MLNDSSLFTSETTATTVVTASTSKVFHSSILSQREALSQLKVQLSFACYSDFQSLAFISDTSEILGLKSDLKSSTEIVLNNEIIIHKFSDDAVQTFIKLTIDYSDI